MCVCISVFVYSISLSRFFFFLKKKSVFVENKEKTENRVIRVKEEIYVSSYDYGNTLICTLLWLYFNKNKAKNILFTCALKKEKKKFVWC